MKFDLNKIESVVFDMDGTLYEGGLAFHIVLNDICHCLWSFNERKCRKDLRNKDFGNAEDFYKVFFESIGKKVNANPQKVRDWYFDRYLPNMVKVVGNNCKVRPNVNELLKSVRVNGLSAHIYSDYPMSDLKAQSLGIGTSLFDHYFCAEEMGSLKPHNRGFEKVCEAIGKNPENVLMIGDTPLTDGGSIKIGMPFICIENKKTKKIDKATAEYDILTWDEIVGLFC